MDWQEEYLRKLVTAEEAISVVKSGDRVAFALDTTGGPVALPEALGGRADELKDIELHMCNPWVDYLWFHPGFEEVFKVTILNFNHQSVRPMLDEKRADYSPLLYGLWGKAEDEGRPGVKVPDVFITEVSPPDKNGFCSFGPDLWSKKWYAKNAKIVLAEVEGSHHIRTYGENYIHVSEIDYFTEHTHPIRQVIQPEADEIIKTIGQYVGTLVRDGDTFGIGAGAIGRTLIAQGIFDDKHDLGYYAENIVPGVVRLVKEGIVTGKRKNYYPGKVICNNLYSGSMEDLYFVENNPMFELYSQQHVVNLVNVAKNDNFVAINGAISIDLLGQIASETMGLRVWGGPGGQPSLAMGAMFSKGGRSVMMLRSTAKGGSISRIVPFLEPGTTVTIPKHFADYIVTEYGIASLLGKSQRQRAQELIAIAHPDFRGELKKQAQKLFWP